MSEDHAISPRQRIEAFRFDDPDAVLPFTSRLAREHGWCHARAGRVVEEYRRFLILAVEAGHPVTPSGDVDHAWHLHLLYTRSYWHDLCGSALGREFHHEPTAGGPAEGAKYFDWYSRTLDSYRRVFDADPPADIWPDPETRFARDGGGRWIDARRHWLLPKPRWPGIRSLWRMFLTRIRRK